MSAETIYSIASKINQKARPTPTSKRRKVPNQFITDGLTPTPFKNEVGYRVVPPEELASLLVPKAHRTSEGYRGYQREIDQNHIFKIVDSIKKGIEIENIQVSLDEYGRAYITDGQHRVLASIAARTPLDVVIKQRSAAQQKAVFESQDFAKKLDKNHMVTVSTDAMSRYVQDALSDTTHPWHDMVSDNKNKAKLTPYAMHRVITMFGCDQVGSLTWEGCHNIQGQFKSSRADDLADLLGVFGRGADGKFSRQNNPLAFQQRNLSALTHAAVQILIRASNVQPAPDKERWMRHMPQFQFVTVAQEINQNDIVDKILNHWNKRLQTPKRVSRKVKAQYGAPPRAPVIKATP